MTPDLWNSTSLTTDATSIVPTDPNTLLTRQATSSALTAAGFPVAAATLATKATRGGGPPYSLFSCRALYRWGDSIAWARSNMTVPRRNTSEADTQRVRAPRSGWAVVMALQRD
jgi:hypothetical protein